jgi:glycosyltransferase involved in cell wall biosynthesis
MPDIIKRHPDAYLSIVGFGHQENEMRALIDKLKLENHIKLCGLVPDELMPAAFNSGLIFILPSLAELEGMVVLEAMSCGKPLVVANSSNSASVHFVQGNGSLFEPENAADLAAKVNALLDSPGERERMGKVSLELSKQYDINKSVDDLIALYNKLKNERILLKSTQPLL